MTAPTSELDGGTIERGAEALRLLLLQEHYPGTFTAVDHPSWHNLHDKAQDVFRRKFCALADAAEFNPLTTLDTKQLATDLHAVVAICTTFAFGPEMRGPWSADDIATLNGRLLGCAARLEGRVAQDGAA